MVPHWTGARLAISPELAAAVRGKLDQARQGMFDGPEMEAVRPILELQARWSRLPAADELLIERVKTREGHHLFFYPVEGRLVHEGLAALFAYRLAQLAPITFTLAANDYGFELLSPDPARLEEALEAGLVSPGPSAARHSGQPQCGRAGPAAVPRDRAGGGAYLSGVSREQQEREAGAGLERAPVRRLCPLRSGEPAPVPGPSRSVGEAAGAEPAGPRAGADGERADQRGRGRATYPAGFLPAGGSGARAGEQREVSRPGETACLRRWSGQRRAATVQRQDRYALHGDGAEAFDDRCRTHHRGRGGLPPRGARAVLAQREHPGGGRPPLGQGLDLPGGRDPRFPSALPATTWPGSTAR